MQSPDDMMAAVVRSMRERTGRTLEQWLDLVSSSDVDPLDQKEVRRWLKDEHDVPQNTQWAIADVAARAAGWIRPDVEQYIDDQYAGDKARLRPVFDRLRAIIEACGDDVSIEGRSTYTPFVRRRQFVAIAATRSRVDVGLRFTRPPPSKLVTEANAPGQATHRLSVATVQDVNAEVGRLLKAAYQQNG